VAEEEIATYERGPALQTKSVHLSHASRTLGIKTFKHLKGLSFVSVVMVVSNGVSVFPARDGSAYVNSYPSLNNQSSTAT
jgi:hypothetical protein